MMKSYGRLLPLVAVAEFARRSLVRAYPFAVVVGVLFLATMHPALATGSGIAAVDSASSGITTLIKALAGIAFLALIGLAIWEFLKHRNFLLAGTELAGGIVAGVIAFNASQVASLFGISGSVV